MCANDKNGTCVCDVGYRSRPDGRGCEWDCACDVCSGPGRCACKSCVYGDCVAGDCRCWNGASGVDCAALNSASRSNYQSPMGVDLGSIDYWSTQWVFVDLMKSSSPGWVSNCEPGMWSDADPAYRTRCQWGNDMPQDLRSDGYPATLNPGQGATALVVFF